MTLALNPAARRILQTSLRGLRTSPTLESLPSSFVGRRLSTFPIRHVPLLAVAPLSRVGGLSSTRHFSWTSKPVAATPPPPVPATATTQPLEELPATLSSTPLPPNLDAAGASSTITDTAAPLIDAADILPQLAPLQLGDIAALGLSPYNPVGVVRSILELINVGTGLPWWATIIVFSVLTRAALMPIILKGLRSNARQLRVMPQIEVYKEGINKARQTGDAIALQKNALEMQRILKENGVNPFSVLLAPFAQIGVSIPSFFAIRSICMYPLEHLKTGGIGWMQDLSAADPLYILPAVTTASMIISLRRGLDENYSPDRTSTGHMANAFMLFGVLGFFVIKGMPAGLVLYFATNSVLMFFQSLALRRSFIRQALDLPPLPPRSDQPFPSALESAQALMQKLAPGTVTPASPPKRR